MIDLTEQISVADRIAINYDGPGFYSGRVKVDLQSVLVLEKISALGVGKTDVKEFAKVLKYNVKPIALEEFNEIPNHWEIISDRLEDIMDYCTD